jgi:hypothetical protein
LKSLLKYFYATENTESINSYDISLAGGLPSWLFLLLTAALAVYAFISYVKESPEMSKKLRAVLSTLRFLVGFILLLLLMRPIVKMDTQENTRTVLPVLIDISSSMSIVESKSSDQYLKEMAEVCGLSKDEAAKLKRIDLVKAILNNQDLDLINKLQAKYSVKLYVFDQETSQLKIGEQTIKLPEATGEATSLSAAVRYVEQSLRGLPVADMILFTDGVHNKGSSPQEMATELKSRDIRLFPVGIGMPENIDVRIESIVMDDLLFVDDEVEVKINFSASGIEEGAMAVQLKLGGKTMKANNVEFRNGRFSESFVIKPEQKGDFNFSVEVEQYPDEFFIENNIQNKQIKVIDAEIRVLLAVQNPSWEFRYLKGMLDGDKRFNTKVFIRTGDKSRSDSDEQYLDSFPLDQLEEIDIIILNNLERDYFSFDDMNKLQDFVAKQGGSLLMISSPSGTPSSYVGTPIEEMLPVTIRKVQESDELDSERSKTRPFKLDLTPEGRDSIITRLVPLAEENVKVWRQLPSQHWYYKGIGRLKPGATALVKHGSVKNEFGSIPLMSYHRFGDGQVLYLGFNSVWRWRYKVGSLYTDRFWSQTIHHMGLNHLLGSSKGVHFQTSKRDYSAGEKIPLNIKIVGNALRSGDEKSIEITAIELQSGEEKIFKLAHSGSKGNYAGQVVLPEGSWDLQLDDSKHRLSINKSQLEFERVSMDKAGLSSLAQLSAGQFIEIPDLNKIPELMLEKPRTRAVILEKSLWDNLFFILLISVLSAAEWLLRKKENLP